MIGAAKDIVAWALSVDNLDVDKLLADWRWLCPETVSLVGRNVFGDLFLCNAAGKILRLQVATGEIVEIANSHPEFLNMLEHEGNREAWLEEEDVRASAAGGLKPDQFQCVGFKMPLVFSESRNVRNNAYVADLYEQVSFLGDLHRQIAAYPDGAKVELVFKR